MYPPTYLSAFSRGTSAHPALWPLVLLGLFCPVVWVVARRYPGFAALVIRRRVRWLGALGIFGVTLFIVNTLTYLHCAAFWDIFESREASVAALLRRGGVVYPSLASQERYCPPYGPALYLIFAGLQALFGATVFATKLASTLANLLSLSLFWRIVRRQYASRTAAWALTGLLAALLMALRQLPFWAKADPLVLCAVITGLFAAFRRGWGWCVLVGLCTGVAVDFKPHALAYFFPVLVIAWQTGWRTRQYVVWAGVATVIAISPFFLWRSSFPAENYFNFLVLTAREGVGTRECVGFCRWVGLLTLMVIAFNRLTFHPQELTSAESTLRRAYHAALAFAVALVAFPACSIGAGQPHLLPLFPAFLLAAGDRFSDSLRVRWRTAPRPFWVALACSTIVACLGITVQTTDRMLSFHQASHLPARACAADVKTLLGKYATLTVLNGSGEGAAMLTTYGRHALVFAGHPIGLDAAGIMDYQRGGAPEPDFPALVAELRSRDPRRQIAWLFPRDATPFAGGNLYDPHRPAYSAEFRREFLARFERGDQSQFYDVYLPRSFAF